MKKFTLIIPVIILCLVSAAYIFRGRFLGSKYTLIGGERDQYGCLIAAGYSWCATKQKCLRTWEEPCPSSEDALSQYLKDNISNLSPRKEVLGGKFYITDLKIISPAEAEVSYEDGHIALKARFNYGFKDGAVTTTNFNLLPEPANTKFNELVFQPKQCEQEPWQTWYSEGKIKFFKTPTDEELIKTYYGQVYSINIISAEKINSDGMVCEACHRCPKNYSFKARVSGPNINALRALGWTN